MRILTCVIFGFSLCSPIYSQSVESKKLIDLPVEAEFCKHIAEACNGRLEIRVFVDEHGDVTIQSTAKAILTRNHRSTNLPGRPNKVTDWHARFVLVPRLNQRDANVMKKSVEHAETLAGKSDWVSYQSFLEKLPNVQSETYAYSVGISNSVPVEENSRSLVLEFIDELAKHLRTDDGSDPRALLRHLLLDER